MTEQRRLAAIVSADVAGYSGLMGAIAGIMICDYWVLRRQRLDLAALFDPKGKYSYSGGWNWRAVAAFFLAVAPAVRSRSSARWPAGPKSKRMADQSNFSGETRPDSSRASWSRQAGTGWLSR